MIEFARNVVGLAGANSTEFDPETPHPVIDLLPEQKEVEDMGGTMRLGAVSVQAGAGLEGVRGLRRAGGLRTAPPPLRGQQQLPPQLAAQGLLVSGTSPDERLVEVIELPDHPWFVASQYHPEFKSRPNRPQPLFREFVGAAVARGSGVERAAQVAGDLTA